MSGGKRGRVDVPRLEGLLERFADLHVVVVGDVILDEYVWGGSERISPEAPVPVVRVARETAALGGAGNVARSVVALGAACDLCGVVGDDEAGRRVRELAERDGLPVEGLVVEAGRPTTTKTRVVARGQQMLRIDRESEAATSRATRARLFERVDAAASRSAGAILADYAKGALAPRWVSRLIVALAAKGLSVAVDPSDGLSGYRGAALVKPNRAEALRLAATGGRDAAAAVDPVDLLARLSRRLPEADWVITDGANGMTVVEPGGEPHRVPTVSRDIFDVQGAGDTTIAALWLTRLAGGSLLEAALVANAAAGVVVGKIGTASASVDEVRERLPEVVDALREST